MNINPLHSTGIRNQIQSSSYSYNKLTKESFKDIINNVFNNYNNQKKQNNYFTIFTDILGYTAFDISFIKSAPKTDISRIKRGKYHFVVSIGSKQSLIKAYYNPRTLSFDVKKGTIFLFNFNSFSKDIFDRIKQYE